jgi:hypothetical protein
VPDTFIKIASVTVGSGGAASMSFTSIPSTYTDLCVKISGRSTSTDDQIWVDFNGSTTGFSNKVLYVQGGSSPASTSVARFVAYQTPGTGTTSNAFGNSEIYIPNYAGSNNKSNSGDAVWEQNATTAYIALNASLWSNTAAIASISLTPQTSNFAQHSTATLYGIKKS